MTGPGPLRVAVLGSRGRMGSEAVRAVEAADDLELVAQVERSGQLDRLVDARVDVAVELTRPDAVMANVAFCIEHGIATVVGTSGLGAADLTAIGDRLSGSRGSHPTGVLVVPNFALGAVLMMRFATEAAPWFDSVEIVELHHPAKVDAPSGTARRTAQLVAAARREAGIGPAPDATDAAGGRSLGGARGADVDGIPVHSVRLRGLVAHQEVLLGGPGETLTLRHDSYDLASFMPGLLLAVRRVCAMPGLTVGLEHALQRSGTASAGHGAPETA